MTRSHIAPLAVIFILLFILLTERFTHAQAPVEEEPAQPHSVGLYTALYNLRFSDEIISPVVYTGSSPLFETFYRYKTDAASHIVALTWTFYTSKLRDADTIIDFKVSDQRGNVYDIPRRLHQLEGSHFEFCYDFLIRVLKTDHRGLSFHLGSNLVYSIDEISGAEYWEGEVIWYSNKTWFSDFTLAFKGRLEHGFRERDLLSLDASVTLLSLVSRPPYYHPIYASEDVVAGDLKYYWKSPADFLRWSAQLSYEFWYKRRFGIGATYQFRNQQVADPRNLSLISHTLGLGVMYGF